MGRPSRLSLALFLAAACCIASPARAAPCGHDWRPGAAAHGFDGRTVFPIGVWIQDPAKAERYRQIGVNLYVGLWRGPTRAQLDRLRKARMPVFGMPTPAARDPAYADVVAGWLLPDEPDNSQRKPDRSGYGPPIEPSEIVSLYCEAAAIAPHRPVLLQLGMGVAWEAWTGRGVRFGRMDDYPKYVRGADIVSFDIYPVTSRVPGVGGRIELIGRGLDRLHAWKTPSQPAWATVGLTRIANPDVTPTPDQIRAQIWMALVHGAQGLIYFVHQFKPTFDEAAIFGDPAALAAVKAENARIQQLAPVLLSPSVAGVAEVLDGDVTVMTKDYNGRRFIFAVSEQPTPQRARIRVASGAAQVKALEGRRRIEAADGVLTDDFPPFGHRAYVLGIPN